MSFAPKACFLVKLLSPLMQRSLPGLLRTKPPRVTACHHTAALGPSLSGPGRRRRPAPTHLRARLPPHSIPLDLQVKVGWSLLARPPQKPKAPRGPPHRHLHSAPPSCPPPDTGGPCPQRLPSSPSRSFQTPPTGSLAPSLPPSRPVPPTRVWVFARSITTADQRHAPHLPCRLPVGEHRRPEDRALCSVGPHAPRTCNRGGRPADMHSAL